MDIRKTVRQVSLKDIDIQSKRVSMVMSKIKEAMLAPLAKKHPPKFTSSDITSLCGIDKAKLAYRLLRGDLPGGVVEGSRRVWSLVDAQAWIADYRSQFKRPKNATGLTITVANFKGGVAKTTTAVTLAQGLSLKGYKVLVIDLDPQGSATTLFGFIPDIDVQREHTALTLFEGVDEMIDSAIRPTYWSGIDLVGAAPMLFSAEFSLPARQIKNPDFEFWKVLELGLDTARRNYDAIIIDTPPALSYVTINALFAAEGVVMPLPPNALDFVSSSQFWDLFSDLSKQLYQNRDQDKTFEFIDVLLSRVETNDSASSIVRQWIIEAYGDKVLPIEIPKTSVAVAASTEFGTIYDIPKGTMSPKTYLRAKDAYDRFCTLVDEQIQSVWANQVEEVNEYIKKLDAENV